MFRKGDLVKGVRTGDYYRVRDAIPSGKLRLCRVRDGLICASMASQVTLVGRNFRPKP